MNADELRIAADLCDDNHFPEAAKVLRERADEIQFRLEQERDYMRANFRSWLLASVPKITIINPDV